MTDEKPAPSGWRMEQAVSAWQSARARILADDAALEGDEAALAELLGDEAATVDQIIERLADAAIHAKWMADSAASRIDEMRARQDRYKRRADQFRATLFAVMEATGDKKRELPFATISIKAGAVSAVVTDETALADEYMRVTRTPDKAAILADLKQGVIVAGAELRNGLDSIQIRSK